MLKRNKEIGPEPVLYRDYYCVNHFLNKGGDIEHAGGERAPPFQKGPPLFATISDAPGWMRFIRDPS